MVDMRSFPLGILSALEVAGRHAIAPMPRLRDRVGRWARRSARADTGPISSAELSAFLRTLGEFDGSHLLVHSSWDAMRRVQLKPSGVIELLLSLLGPRGTLLMPTHPLPLRLGMPAVYDVARTLSSVGLLSESLRRTAGALRSSFPIAPVCALGPDAPAYTADFRGESGGTPYGRGSPYWRLGQSRGKALFIGIDFIRANTLEHVAFDLLGEDNPIRDYYVEHTVTVVRGDLREEWRVRCEHPGLERFLATTTFKCMILDAGLIRVLSLRGLSLALLDAPAFLAWHQPIARRTGLPYWGFPRARRKLVA